jgi:tight adherence protein C
MTFMLFALGVIMVGLSGRLVARAIVLPRLHLKVHLRAVFDYGFDPSRATDGDPRTRLARTLERVAIRLGRVTLARAGFLRPLLRGELTSAGFYDVSTEAVHGYRALATILISGLVLFFVMATGAAFSLTVLLMLLAGAAAGWLLPAFVIKQRGTSRLDEMDVHLPELIDLLIATVESGMGFGASVDLVAGRFKGPLGDELRLTVKQQSLGISTEHALEDMVERCDTPSIRAFVRTVVRGDSLGVSIGPILRELSADMRRRRRMTAKEKMQKAPVKMMFPLMFLIFPPLMIELMYPAAYSVLHNLSGG